MMGLNRVTLIGHLGKDPEVRTAKTGAAFTVLSLATAEAWTQDGERKERVTWHRVVLWGPPGELAAKYLTKGRQVYIEGKLEYRRWEDETGAKKYTAQVNAQTILMLGSKSD